MVWQHPRNHGILAILMSFLNYEQCKNYVFDAATCVIVTQKVNLHINTLHFIIANIVKFLL